VAPSGPRWTKPTPLCARSRSVAARPRLEVSEHASERTAREGPQPEEVGEGVGHAAGVGRCGQRLRSGHEVFGTPDRAAQGRAPKGENPGPEGICSDIDRDHAKCSNSRSRRRLSRQDACSQRHRPSRAAIAQRRLDDFVHFRFRVRRLRRLTRHDERQREEAPTGEGEAPGGEVQLHWHARSVLGPLRADAGGDRRRPRACRVRRVPVGCSQLMCQWHKEYRARHREVAGPDFPGGLDRATVDETSPPRSQAAESECVDPDTGPDVPISGPRDRAHGAGEHASRSRRSSPRRLYDVRQRSAAGCRRARRRGARPILRRHGSDALAARRDVRDPVADRPTGELHRGLHGCSGDVYRPACRRRWRDRRVVPERAPAVSLRRLPDVAELTLS
jgi:hypothetical protein